MSVAIIILLFVQNELSYDNSHENRDGIYRLVLERQTPQGTIYDITTPPPLAPALLEDLSQIRAAVRFLHADNPIPLLSNEGKRFYEEGFYFADPSVFSLFSINTVQGDLESALTKPNCIVLTRKMARKYFGNHDPLGKVIYFNNFLDLEVTAVIEELPENSTVRFDFLTSFSTLKNWLGQEFLTNWQNYLCHTYLILQRNNNVEDISKYIPNIINNYWGNDHAIKNIHLQPLNRIHLYSIEDYSLNSDGNINYVYLLSTIALFILLIASINFINMSTAQAMRRAKEIGIRKVVGADRKQLFSQFLIDVMVSVVLSLTAAMALVIVILPIVNEMLGRNIAQIDSFNLLIIPLAIVLLISLIVNSYPAIYMSRIDPILILKDSKGGNSRKSTVRRILIISQFAVTIILVINTWIAFNQLDYMRKTSFYSEKEKIVIIPIRNYTLRTNPESIKNKLLEIPGIFDVGAAALLPGGPVGKARFRIDGNSDEGTMSMLWVDHDFIRTLSLEMIAGRDFSLQHPTDFKESIILNEEAVKKLGWNDPHDALGKNFEIIGDKRGRIIGVVKNFHYTSLQHKIEPLVLNMWKWMNYLLVKVDSNQLSIILDQIEDIMYQFDHDNPFSFSFLDQNFDRLYNSEKMFGDLSGYFTCLAIVIACIGLFSLSMFTVEQSVKEIGIRKVLGAKIFSLVALQLKEYFILILIANIVSIPLSYWIISKWLQDYAYKVNMDYSIFIIVSLSSVLIAFFTIAYHVIKAALRDPILALHQE